VAFAARPPTNLLATASVSLPAAAWRCDLWGQKWQTAHDDNAQMAGDPTTQHHILHWPEYNHT